MFGSALLLKAMVFKIKSSYRVNAWFPREITTKVHRDSESRFTSQALAVSAPPIRFSLAEVKQNEKSCVYTVLCNLCV